MLWKRTTLAVIATVAALLPWRSGRAQGTGAAGSQSIALPTAGAYYSAAADYPKGWADKKNPYGVWTYGWSKGLYGKFVLFPTASILPYNNRKQAGWYDPSVDEGYTPSVRFNFGEDYDDSNVDYRANAFILHGGGKGTMDYAHVIWTAPAAGNYSVEAAFEGQQHDVDADAHILVSAQAAPKPDAMMEIHLDDGFGHGGNKVSCFDTTVTADQMKRTYTGNLTLAEGDVIDFAVGLNGKSTLHPGCVGLEAVIQKR